MAERLKRFTPTETDKEALTFHLIFAIAFSAFLLEAIGRRLLLRQARAGAHADDHKSIIAEAKAAAGRCVPFAFMG
jgi:hypothetical protein